VLFYDVVVGYKIIVGLKETNMATVLGTIDHGGDGNVVLLALINAKENTNLVMSDFVFSDPEIPSEINPIRNTKIKLIPKAASGYYGVKTIYYNRVHLSELGAVTIEKGSAINLVDLLPSINTKYGVYIKPSDVVDYRLPSVGTSQDIVVTLDFTSTSVVFYSSEQMTLEGSSLDPEFILDTMLSGSTKRDLSNSLLGSNLSVVDSFTLGIDIYGSKETHKDNFLNSDLNLSAFNDRVVDKETKIENIYPFVHLWKNGTLTYGVTYHGLVLSTSNSAELWTVVSKIPEPARNLSGNLTDATCNVTNVVSNSTGVFAIVKQGTSYKLYKGSVLGLDWSASTHNLNTLNVFKPTNTALKVSHLDIHGNTISVVVGGPRTAVLNNTTYSLPLVETLNFETGVLSIKSLSSIAIGNNSFVLGDNTNSLNKFSFLSSSLLSVYGIIKGANTPAIIVYDLSSTGTASLVCNGALSFNELDNGLAYINSYSINLVNNTNAFIDVIEIPIKIRKASPDLYYFTDNPTLEDSWYWTYGVRVYHSIRIGSNRRAWNETDFTLASGQHPQQLIINNTLGKRLFHAQLSDSIFGFRFTWNSSIQDYQVQKDHLFTVESKHLYNGIGNIAGGEYHPVVIVENINGIYNDLYGNLPIVGTGFDYSFSLTKGTEKNWALGLASNQVLSTSDNFSYPKFFNSPPLALFSDQFNVYALLDKNKGIAKSVDGGVTWTGFGQSKLIGKRDSSNSITNNGVISVTSLKLLPSNFKNAVIENSVITLETKFNADLPVVSFENNTLVTSKVNITNHGLVNFSENLLEISDRYSTPLLVTTTGSVSFNVLSDLNYASVHAWDCTSTPGVVQQFGIINQYLTSSISQTNVSPYVINSSKTIVPVTATNRVKHLELNFLVSGYEVLNGNRNYYLFASRTTNGTTTQLELPLTLGVPGLVNFIPEIGMHIWDNLETDYVPYVFYSAKRFLLTGRLDSNKSFNFYSQTPNIPSNNNNDLIPVPMFNSNRKDYLFLQKGNGIFKLVYNYDPGTNESLLTLVRLFDISAWEDQTWDFSSGTIKGTGPVLAPLISVSRQSAELMNEGYSFFESGEDFTPSITGIYETGSPTITGIYVPSGP
jgi:hypothetical protein